MVCDFFTAEVITPVGLVTYYVRMFMHIGSRKVYMAGVTPHANEQWMKQIARNITMEDWGIVTNGRYLIHDRDSKFCESFRDIMRASGVKPLKLPARSPNLNVLLSGGGVMTRMGRHLKSWCKSFTTKRPNEF